MSFSIRTRNECSISSDLAIHKLFDFCTTFLWEVVFSKLIIKSENRFFLKNAKNVLRAALFVSIYEWMICVKIVKCIHPISCAW